jgi:transposase
LSQALALNEGVARKPGLWSRQGRARFEALPLWTARRRQDGLELLDELLRRTQPLDQAVEQEAEQRPEVMRLMTHPGVGPLTALAFVLTLGDPGRTLPSALHL